MNNQKGFTLINILIVIAYILMLVGWVANIVKLAGSTFDVITGMIVLRVIGVVVPPVGAVMGFL